MVVACWICILSSFSAVYKNCDDILKHSKTRSGNKNDRYAIDPDQAGGEDIFGVVCDFTSVNNMGITWVGAAVGRYYMCRCDG